MHPPFRIIICGLQDLHHHVDANITHVLSILDPSFPAPQVFEEYGAHTKLELRFDDIIEERKSLVAPTQEDVKAALAFGREMMAAPTARLLVHCHAGISRSSACLSLLMAQAMPESPAEDLFQEVLRIRPQIWPNLRIVEFGDALLGRGGTMVEAAKRVYARQLRREPDLEEDMRFCKRDREVEAGLALNGLTAPARGARR
ncbi:MAG TPA: protein-tyrosine-phosphatase [Acidocella sp.]|nr:protein-tyrosine-phosphatase [Acidocella sp.]